MENNVGLKTFQTENNGCKYIELKLNILVSLLFVEPNGAKMAFWLLVTTKGYNNRPSISIQQYREERNITLVLLKR